MAVRNRTDMNIEILRIKRLIKNFETVRGNETSMISLFIPPHDQISRVNKMLDDHLETASNIKSEVNRQSVLDAITSVQQRLKLYNNIPSNGLVIYTGTIATEDGKGKKVAVSFEPFRPINVSLYLCSSKFHTEPLKELLESDAKFGFIVMDGRDTLFGILSDNTNEVLHKFSVNLPMNHGRRRQSAQSTAHLHMEKLHDYLIAELATHFYIDPATNLPNVSGLILAYSVKFKTQLRQLDMFDPRLQAIVLHHVDVSYGGEIGFNQAIELSADILSKVKPVREMRLIRKYFEKINEDNGKYVFGVDDTLNALQMSSVAILIVWENLNINRFVLRNKATGEIVIKHINSEQETDRNNFRDFTNSADYKVEENMPLLSWLVNEYKKFGCNLELVTDQTPEGSQFCKGFDGIGGILWDDKLCDDFSDGKVYDEDELQSMKHFLLQSQKKEVVTHCEASPVPPSSTTPQRCLTSTTGVASPIPHSSPSLQRSSTSTTTVAASPVPSSSVPPSSLLQRYSTSTTVTASPVLPSTSLSPRCSTSTTRAASVVPPPPLLFPGCLPSTSQAASPLAPWPLLFPSCLTSTTPPAFYFSPLPSFSRSLTSTTPPAFYVPPLPSFSRSLTSTTPATSVAPPFPMFFPSFLTPTTPSASPNRPSSSLYPRSTSLATSPVPPSSSLPRCLTSTTPASTSPVPSSYPRHFHDA